MMYDVILKNYEKIIYPRSQNLLLSVRVVILCITYSDPDLVMQDLRNKSHIIS